MSRLLVRATFLAFLGFCSASVGEDPQVAKLSGNSFAFQIQLPAGADVASAPAVELSIESELYPSDRFVVSPVAKTAQAAASYNVVIKPLTDGGATSAGPYSVRGRYLLGTKTRVFSTSVEFSATGTLQTAAPSGSTALPGVNRPVAAAAAGDATRKALGTELSSAVIDLARRAKVPGVAYYDHEPRATCRAFVTEFQKLATLVSSQPNPELTDSEAASIRTAMINQVNSVYASRDGIQRDWQPFLQSVQELVGARHDIDLSKRDDVQLVFASIVEAFQQMERMHRDADWPDFPSTTAGGGQGYGGASGNVGTGYGSQSGGACPHCRHRNRRCRCARLLFGF